MYSKTLPTEVENLILDYLYQEPYDKKLELVLPFINTIDYEEWIDLPLLTGVANRIFLARPYVSLKQL
mgnify:CR=1 FL=1